MANPAHLKVLDHGVDEWNKWRGENPSNPDLAGSDFRRVNLSEVDLSETNLSSANLYRANLREANLGSATLVKSELYGANLDRAYLARADLAKADLSDAVLTAAELSQAYLYGANLHGANLAEAILTGANLHLTNLTKADLSQAALGGTIFADVDLTNVRGLEECVHLAPSIVDFRTFARSQGIPDVFLRGCGYRPGIYRLLVGDKKSKIDAFYEWLEQDDPALKLDSCFISYSTEDKQFVDLLQRSLNDRGVDYWYAPEHGEWGKELAVQIDREISVRDRVIVVCSEASLGDSDWVRYEIERAIEEEKKRRSRVVFPIMLDDALLKWKHPLSTRIRDVLAGDFRNATKGKIFQQRFEKLCEGLSKRK